jgi:hypothetical protein
VKVTIPTKPKFEVSDKLEICLGDSLPLQVFGFSNLYEPRVRILEGSNLTLIPGKLNPQNLETNNFIITKPKTDTIVPEPVVWVKPKTTFNNFNLKIYGSNCDKAVLALYDENPPIGVNLEDSISAYNLYFDTTLVVVIGAGSCGASLPNLVLVNGLTRNQGFYIYQITSQKDNPTSWPLLNGGSLKIYNRWGKEIYATDFYRNELSYDKLTTDYRDGVYFYHYLNKEKNVEKTGYFNLMR